MVMEIDNSNCKANIPTISVGVHNKVQMNSNGAVTSDHGTIFSKQINGLGAGQTAKVMFFLFRAKMRSERLLI